jgi:poly(3-hydroxybutyrate) depolymerase
MSPVYKDIPPPIMLMHGVDDETVPIAQACMMYDAMSDHPRASVRYSADGEQLSGTMDDCQGPLQTTDPWESAAADSGVVMAMFEGVGHRVVGEPWDRTWAAIDRWNQ